MRLPALTTSEFLPVSNLNPVLSAEAGREDSGHDRALRPIYLADYIGQKAVHEQMQVFIGAARKRREALDHVLLCGPPGLGKTTLAHIIGHEMQVSLRQTSGPALEKPGDLAAMLTNLNERDVLFIDEMHRLSPVVEEVLYPAMEDFHIDIVIGEGPAARAIKLDVPPFTLVGATTRAGLLTAPLRDRFGIIQRLLFYDIGELTSIVRRSAGILGVELEPGGATELAGRARGTPRIANRLLRRVRDYAEMRGDGTITEGVAREALDLLKVDSVGLDDMDRRVLLVIMEKFSGGPVGLDTLAAATHEDRGTLEDVIEPFLLQQGFLQRTPRGRVVTARAWQYLGLKPPAGSDSDLFVGQDE